MRIRNVQVNAQLSAQSPTQPMSDTITDSAALQDPTTPAPQHYAIVESDHPYKPATVANYKVIIV